MGKCLSKSKKSVDESPLSLKQFEVLRSVGRGAFGKVRVVRKKSDKQLYALKYINKAKCIQQRAARNTIFERNLLVQLDYPLIVNLRYAFQDDETMFMVLDLMLGGDLKYHLQQTGSFPEQAVRVYAAEMICAIEYLQSRSVVHRDIKPDNLLLDDKGHVHLTDFNVATYLPEDGAPLRSFSGTLTYMAPEVIQRQEYRGEVDWWSMGVVIYELLFGKRPFRGRTTKEIATRICKGSLVFPTTREVSDQCYDFISKLLKKSPAERLGCGPRGVENIKAHPWLAGIDWRMVPEKRLRPVFVPDPDRPNFNAIFEAEDALLEDRPLRAHRKSLKTPETLDEQFIQSGFADFDFCQRAAEESRRRELMQASMALEAEKSDDPGISVLSSRLSMKDMSDEAVDGLVNEEDQQRNL